MSTPERLIERVAGCLPTWTPPELAARAVLAAIVDELVLSDSLEPCPSGCGNERVKG